MSALTNFLRKRQKRFKENLVHFYHKHVEPSACYREVCRKRWGGGKYTVISACYNVEKYIAEFIESIIDQRLLFKNHLFLICVDDGSTDRTAEIIKKYAAKYPENITYIFKQNGGQASARNLGMEYAKTEWITFCDPDDILEYNYFYIIDKYIDDYEDVNMVASNVYMYFENNRRISNTHALRYKFEKNVSIKDINNLGNYVQFFVNSALFRKSIINKYNLIQDPRIKPNFEDGHFIAKYLMYAREGKAMFLKKSIYYYRKREDNTSTLNLSWSDKRKFSDIFLYGYLDMLESYSQNGITNNYEKHVFVYDVMWQIRRLVDCHERIGFMSKDEISRYVQYLKSCFAYIDRDFIQYADVKDCHWYWRMGMLKCFKNEDPDYYIAYIDMYDSVKKECRIKLFCGTEGNEIFFVDNKEIVPSWSKTLAHDFCGHVFILERIFWIPLPEKGSLNFTYLGQNVQLQLAGKNYEEGVDLELIRRVFNIDRKSSESSPFLNCWLFMDRDIYADDNAEHMYRYLMKECSEVKAFFVLKRESKDWKRLEEEGFKLLAFHSKEHKNALRACSKIISSHADPYVTDYFGAGSLRDKQFIFLQHCVTKDNLSRWLNSKQRIDLFVTSTWEEQKSITGSGSPYKFFEREVKLLGMPRYDSLLQPATQRRQILVMPTWRAYIVTRKASGEADNKQDAAFMQTEYAKAWKSFLGHPRLRNLHERYGFDFVFIPHPILRVFLSKFELPEFIQVPEGEECNYQALFRSSAALITDYSSVAFDMAFLQKAILYYQFDEKVFFSGEHMLQRGYFDYRRDGFGPVLTVEDKLFEELELLFQRDGRPEACYLERMQKTFAFRDGKNCERVFQAILELDKEGACG